MTNERIQTAALNDYEGRIIERLNYLKADIRRAGRMLSWHHQRYVDIRSRHDEFRLQYPQHCKATDDFVLDRVFIDQKFLGFSRLRNCTIRSCGEGVDMSVRVEFRRLNTGVTRAFLVKENGDEILSYPYRDISEETADELRDARVNRCDDDGAFALFGL